MVESGKKLRIFHRQKFHEMMIWVESGEKIRIFHREEEFVDRGFCATWWNILRNFYYSTIE